MRRNIQQLQIRRNYSTPEITSIKLDNEISLALASDPPTPGNENASITTDYFNNDPFKAVC